MVCSSALAKLVYLVYKLVSGVVLHVGMIYLKVNVDNTPHSLNVTIVNHVLKTMHYTADTFCIR